jgi:hypothetical protein
MNKIFLKKFFKFKFFYFNEKKRIIFINRNFYHFLILIYFLTNIKKFIIFLPKNFNINNITYISFWKRGLISNFKQFRWRFIKFFFLSKNLPFLLINLTNKKEINIEIKRKNVPLINFFQQNKIDFFFSKKSILKLNRLDNTYMNLILLNYIKRYRNV